MPRPRFYNLSEADRGRLLGVALKEFESHGFADASLNRILAAARVSKGAYYYYFDDKEDLFATVIEHVLDDALRHLRMPRLEQLTRATFWPAMAKAVGEWHALFDSSRDLRRAARTLDAARFESPAFARVLGKTRAFWLAIIKAGQRLGCVRTDLPDALLVGLVEASDHALDAALSTRKRVTRRAFATHVDLAFDTFKRLLAAKQEAP